MHVLQSRWQKLPVTQSTTAQGSKLQLGHWEGGLVVGGKGVVAKKKHKKAHFFENISLKFKAIIGAENKHKNTTPTPQKIHNESQQTSIKTNIWKVTLMLLFWLSMAISSRHKIKTAFDLTMGIGSSILKVSQNKTTPNRFFELKKWIYSFTMSLTIQ